MIGVAGTDVTLEVYSVDTSPRDRDAGDEDCRLVMRKPVDGDEDESGKKRSSGMGSINAYKASLGETSIDDEPTESIRSDIN